MISQKSLSIILVVVIIALSYQTVVLAQMSSKLEEAQIGLGASPTAVSFTDDGSAPQMVGGC
ncbi:MAG: hypothetical protein COX81_03760 [Candidatus Magasanikbacteria bacterium CG_4_10_14_0_2_um_filter_37_12]|uniref:Uncharacterized protein n=2 Tax=Parcubacteria group TaxID=1794811 RepID=A0A2M8C0Q7_9BACT|nr:MAG: hypothetical protein COX81_03760 [Candidatus Magasanikbacteria bacterium CG_4_10_14_0_2_um_filter_37_12]PJB49706.1 MAG: hypothetical protein CO102_03180 [Candidatus Brennerbacteria bacterium CG_4_9_14_3_um_filter_43_9]